MSEFVEGLFVRDDDEGLFSRDINGQLIRLDEPTEKQYFKPVKIQIDGQEVTVPLARPLEDAQGNPVQDVNGSSIPRYTTIYDAAHELYVKQQGGDEARIPIPTLCHLPHMKPVAVCRLCVVQISVQKRGKQEKERKLLPACQYQVQEGMEVFTMNAVEKEDKDGKIKGELTDDAKRIRQTVKMLTEMLATDHLKPAEPAELEEEFKPFNELGKMVDRCGAKMDRLLSQRDVLTAPPPLAQPLAGRRDKDTTSAVFQVDHSACILCDRCVRACDDVQQNLIIGRTGKGATAGIGFDLNDPMGSSGCVQCGECMVSCPTSAITFKSSARVQIARDRSQEAISVSELLSDRIFAGISPKFLLWQQGLVVRRKLKKGDVLCRKGDPGNTAFLLRTCDVGITFPKSAAGSGGFLSRLAAPTRGKESDTIVVTKDKVITGEMACISGTPRTATVTALEPGEVWEIRRNVLDRLMRLPSRRELFERRYRENVLDVVLRTSELFHDLDKATFEGVTAFLKQKGVLSFVRVGAGQKMFNQGDEADALYFVRLGHVRVGVRQFGAEARVFSRGPGAIIGEIAALGLSRADIIKSEKQVDAEIAQALANASGDLSVALPPGKRTATCSALGPVELARLDRKNFLQMVRDFPVVRGRLVELSLKRLREERTGDMLRTEFVDQGLYEGNSILVLDLDRCTRCDQCTRGCVEEHGYESHGVLLPRMLRDGERFANFVVATSCRSCTNAHCMVGCPVDSIHRGKHLQIVIEDHCIGCGLCADNCPYGSIFMEANQGKLVQAHSPVSAGSSAKIGQLKATACDLCDSHGDDSSPDPQCVASCPHDAAFRMTGPELLQRVLGSR